MMIHPHSLTPTQHPTPFIILLILLTMDSYIFKGIIIKNQRNEQVFMEVIDLLYEDKIKYESL